MKNQTEILPLKGCFSLSIFNAQNGQLIEQTQSNNLVVQAGIDHLISLLDGSNTKGAAIKHIAFGTDASKPRERDATIQDAFLKDIKEHERLPKGLRLHWELAAAEANGLAIAEFGLLTEGGKLFARKTRSVINKTPDIRLVGQWTISFEN